MMDRVAVGVGERKLEADRWWFLYNEAMVFSSCGRGVEHVADLCTWVFLFLLRTIRVGISPFLRMAWKLAQVGLEVPCER